MKKYIILATIITVGILSIFYYKWKVNSFEYFIRQSNQIYYKYIEFNKILKINSRIATPQKINISFEQLLLDYIEKKNNNVKAFAILYTECPSTTWTLVDSDFKDKLIFNNAPQDRINDLRKRVDVVKKIVSFDKNMYLFFMNKECKNYNYNNFVKNVAEYQDNVFAIYEPDQTLEIGVGTHWIIDDKFNIIVYYQIGKQVLFWNNETVYYYALLKIPKYRWRKHHIYKFLQDNKIYSL